MPERMLAMKTISNCLRWGLPLRARQASKQARAAVEFILAGQLPSKEVTCY
jgi:hypothetical protein